MKAVLALAAALLLIGCGAQSATPPAEDPQPQPEAVTPPPAPAKSAVYDQLHAAFFQADASIEKIRKALDIAQSTLDKLPEDVAPDVKDMIATLDDDGAVLADRTSEELPPIEEVAKDEDKYKGKVTEFLSVIEDVLQDIREQEGVAASLAEMGPPETVKSFEQIDEFLNQALDDLLECKKTLGGT
jgi:hypothetical protein